VLSRDENEYITRVGAGTPMGGLMRQYWMPAMLSSELARPDCPPVRVLLLGERLIAFRDGGGRVRLLASEAPARVHPCHERGGVVWAYLGPREPPPPLPDLEANRLAEGRWQVSAIQRACNWLQGLEGDIDTAHIGFLHFGSECAEDQPAETFRHYVMRDRAPRYALLDTAYGAMYGAYRAARPGHRYWRIAQFLFPFYTMPPSGLLGHQIVARAWVPMDDTHLMLFSMSATPEPGDSLTPSIPDVEPATGRGPAAAQRLLPNEPDWYGRFRLDAGASGDYGHDRERQARDEEYSGIAGVHVQDQAITESMGPIVDRTKEHLGSSDAMVIRVRRRLIATARSAAERGTSPPGVDRPDVYRQRSGGVVLEEAADWVAATADLRRAYVTHPGLDRTVTGGFV